LVLALLPAADGVAHLAHLGGFAAGFVYLKTADWRLRRAERHLRRLSGAGRPGGRRPDCRPGEGVRGGAGPGACGDRSRAGQDLRARDRLAHRGRAALPRGDEPPDAGSEVGPARLSRGRPVPKLGAAAPMLVNLVPEFLAVLAAPDPLAAYHDYLDRHRPVLASYWRNYVLDPDAPQAEPVIAAALRAD